MRFSSHEVAYSEKQNSIAIIVKERGYKVLVDKRCNGYQSLLRFCMLNIPLGFIDLPYKTKACIIRSQFCCWLRCHQLARFQVDNYHTFSTRFSRVYLFGVFIKTLLEDCSHYQKSATAPDVRDDLLLTIHVVKSATSVSFQKNPSFFRLALFVANSTDFNPGCISLSIYSWIIISRAKLMFVGRQKVHIPTPKLLELLSQQVLLHLCEAGVPHLLKKHANEIPKQVLPLLHKQKLLTTQKQKQQKKLSKNVPKRHNSILPAAAFTRGACSKLASVIIQSAKVKFPIEYDNGSRFLVGKPIKLTPLPKLLRSDYSFPKFSEKVLKKRRLMLIGLNKLHNGAREYEESLRAPRGVWEDWIEPFRQCPEADHAFMCLVVILMSSSTSDDILSRFVPRFLALGIVSPKAVLDIVSRYGVNCFCSLFAESGRYYQNAERILNAADYFCREHNGRVPGNISVLELCTLYGVGYKTANIVLTTAFNRVDGIPSDIHVLRWSYLLGWTTDMSDGLLCSKSMESWLPKMYWTKINPMFGCLGQLLGSKSKSVELLDYIDAQNIPYMSKLFKKAALMYERVERSKVPKVNT